MQDAKSDSSSSIKPKMCGDAIQQGLVEFNNGNYDRALDLFTGALELPGNGFMRLSGTKIPRQRTFCNACARLSYALRFRRAWRIVGTCGQVCGTRRQKSAGSHVHINASRDTYESLACFIVISCGILEVCFVSAVCRVAGE